MNRYVLLILLISGCNLDDSKSSSVLADKEIEKRNKTDKEIEKRNKIDKTNQKNGDKNNKNNDNNSDDFIVSLKTLDKAQIEPELSKYIYGKLNGVIEQDKKLAKIKEIISSDIIVNLYYNDPAKIKYFYEKCSFYVDSKNKDKLNDHVKSILMLNENVTMFLSKDYITAFDSLPEYLKKDKELQGKYVAFLINKNKLKAVISSVISSNKYVHENNVLLLNLYENGARQQIKDFFSDDYVDSLDKNNLLKVSNILGYQKYGKIRDSALFATKNNIEIPYVEQRYNLYTLLEYNIPFEEYDRILGKFYNYDNYLKAVLSKSTNKNKDIDFIIRNNKNLPPEILKKINDMRV